MTGGLPVGGASAEMIEAIARRTIDELPPEFRAHLGAVVLRVEELADARTLSEMEIDDPMDLSGLYSGRPLGDKSVSDSGAMPDMIHLYRRPILAEARADGIALDRLVAHVVIHEIGHHFGFSDEDMDALLDAAD